VARLDIPPRLEQQTDIVHFRVEMDGQPQIWDQVEDQVTIGSLVVYPNWEKSGVAGGKVYYPHRITNNSNIDDQAELQVSSSNGWEVVLYLDQDLDGLPDDLDASPGPDAIAIDANGSGDFTDDPGDFIDPSFDSNSNDMPDTPLLLAGGEDPQSTMGYVLQLSIPGAAVENTVDILEFTATSFQVPTRNPTATDKTTVLPRLKLFPEDHVLYGAPSTSVYFAYTLTNSWDEDDRVTFSAVTGATCTGLDWTLVLWPDSNGDGIIDGLPFSPTDEHHAQKVSFAWP